MVNGEKLALEEAGGKVGKFTIKYVSLDDATAAAGKWDPGQTSAERAQGRPGPVDHRLPRRVQLGRDRRSRSRSSTRPNILQISPSNTYVGLTRSEGADKGEPDKYYPSGKRTYGRVVPADHIQAAAQVTYQKDQGCKKTYILNDKEVYGKGIADQVAEHRQGPGPRRSPATTASTPRPPTSARWRRRSSPSGADCMFFGGITQNKGVQVFKDVNAANPTMKLFGPDGVAESAFSSKLGSAVEKQTYITNPTLDPKLYPPAAQDFFAKFKAEVRQRPGAVRDLRLRGDEGRPRWPSRTRVTRATTSRP